MACCLPTCAQRSSVPVKENTVLGVFWAFGFLLGALCIWRVLALLVSLLCTRLWVTSMCLLLDTPFGRRSVGALPL